MSKLFGILRAMDAHERRNAPEPVEAGIVPESDEHGYWTRRPDGGLHYHAYDPATEDDEDCDEQPVQPVTCHRCGAVVDSDALAVQTAADETPKLGAVYCRVHLVAGTQRLRTAMQAQREGE
jgi:hypothetical protein